MFKNIIIGILSAGWITSLPFFYGEWDWFIIIATAVIIACIQIDGFVDDVKEHKRFMRKLDAELRAANREAQRKIG